MKKIVVGFLLGCSALGLAGLCRAEDRTYGDYLVNNKALSYSANFDLKLDTIDDLSVVAVYSSATIASVSFTSASVTLATSRITATAHGLTNGNPVLATTGGALPSGLSAGTTYYANVVDANTIRLSTTSAQAQAGTYITFGDVGTGSSTLTPTPFAGTYSFKFQGSNDKVNFFDLVNASSVTYSAPGVSEWDGPIYCRWLRLAVTAGTGGGLNLQVIGNGKRKS
jgi:hypothetical protein